MKRKAGDPWKYRGLEMSAESRELLNTDRERFASYCNGIGSKQWLPDWLHQFRFMRWLEWILWKITPDTIWFKDFTDCSDPHDGDYSVKTHFHTEKEAMEFWAAANLRFLMNLQKRIREHGGWFESMRMRRAWKYYQFVSTRSAWNGFMKNKTIG